MKRLLDLLRETDTSVKLGCEEGVCGACTVMVDGSLTAACRAWAVDAHKSPVSTARTLGADPKNQALLRWMAGTDLFQCGYCAPGLFVAACYMSRVASDIDHRELEQIIDHQVCRCGGSRPSRQVLTWLWAAGRTDR